jgi:hypothetical protein
MTEPLLAIGWHKRQRSRRKSMANTDFYLSVTGPFGNGSGSDPSNPVDCSTPTKLQTFWSTHSNPGTNNTYTFHYAPGIFQTGGANPSFANSAFDHIYHYGAGVDVTILQLTGSAAKGYGFFSTNQGRVDWQLQNMTCDCNAVNQPKWTGCKQSRRYYCGCDVRCVKQPV